MRKQAGFTLIELVVVIVILGILAATAAPKFIDLTSDARSSVVEALQGTLKSARDMGHAKALIEGETGNADISIAGETIGLVEGWPSAEDINLLIDIDGDISETGTGTGIFQHTTATTPANCQVTYTDTDDNNEAPEVTIDISDC